MTLAAIPEVGFRPIPAEPWGRRLARVRQDIAGYTLLEAAALAGYFLLTSDASISRLEALDVEPVGSRQRSRRQLAYVLCMAYNVDPAEFGLTADDIPPGVNIPPRSTQSSTKCSGAVYPLRPGRTRKLGAAKAA